MKARLLLLFSIIFLAGCPSEHEKLVANQTAYQNLLKQTDQLYKDYFNGTSEEARRSLQKIILLVENSRLAPEMQKGRAAVLFLAYGRLYALDRRVGNDDSAQIDLVNARYWCMRKDELDGDTPTGCAAYLAKFASTDTLVHFVNGFDRGANNGNLPRYVQTP